MTDQSVVPKEVTVGCWPNAGVAGRPLNKLLPAEGLGPGPWSAMSSPKSEDEVVVVVMSFSRDPPKERAKGVGSMSSCAEACRFSVPGENDPAPAPAPPALAERDRPALPPAMLS